MKYRRPPSATVIASENVYRKDMRTHHLFSMLTLHTSHATFMTVEVTTYDGAIYYDRQTRDRTPQSLKTHPQVHCER